MIKLKKLIVQNFLSFKGKLELELDNLGSTIIIGNNQTDEGCDSNRSGKSNLLIAIYFVLTGETLKNIKVESIVNWEAKKDCYVSLELEINSKNYKIIRSRKSSKYESGFRIYDGDVDITPREASEQKKILTQILGTTSKEFASNFFFTASLPKFIDSKDKAKVFEKLIRLENFEQSVLNARNKRKDCDVTLAVSKEKLENIESIISDLKLKKSQLELASTEWIEEHKKRKFKADYELASHTSNESSILKAKESYSEIESLNEKIIELQNKLQDEKFELILSNKSNQERVDDLTKQLDNLNDEFLKIPNSDSDLIKKELEELTNIQEENIKISREIDKLENNLESSENIDCLETMEIGKLKDELSKLSTKEDETIFSESSEITLLLSLEVDLKNKDVSDSIELNNIKHEFENVNKEINIMKEGKESSLKCLTCDRDYDEETKVRVENDLESKIRVLETTKKDLMTQALNKKKELVDEINTDIENISKKIIDLKVSLVEDNKKSIKKIESDIETETEKALKDKETYVSLLKKELEEAKEKLEEVDISKIDSLKVDLAKSNTNKEAKVKLISDIKTIKTSIDSILVLSDADILDLINEKENISNEINQSKEKISNLDQTISKEDILNFFVKKSELEAEVKNVNSQVNINIDMIKQCDDLIDLKCKSLIETEEAFNKINLKWQSYNFWEKNFRKVRLKLFQDIIPLFNEQLLKWCNLIAGKDFVLQFDEKMNATKDSIQYESDSRGCQQRLDLCCQIALLNIRKLRSGITSNIMVFDEWAESLDRGGIDGFERFIDELSKTFDSILIVSHNEYLQKIIPNRIEIVKSSGVSSIL